MKHIDKIAMAAALAALTGCGNGQHDMEKGYIGAHDVTIQDGIFTEHTLLQLGRLGDPQLSPDGSRIIYGVSYISEQENRSCRNIFAINADGSGKTQLTACCKSVDNARFSPDGKKLLFIQDGQIWEAPLKGNSLGSKKRISDVKRGISGFELSPDGTRLFYISTIPGPVQTASDIDPALDKAEAYAADDLMYRHWDHWVTETPRTYVASLTEGMITGDISRDILDGEAPGFELPTEPFGGTEQLNWAPDSRHIAFSCRKLRGREYAFSTNTDIFVYDIVTGLTLRITDGGGYDTDPVWSPDGSRLAWISMARDGYEADAQRIMLAEIERDPRADEINGLCISVKDVYEIAANLDADKTGLKWAPDGKSIYFNATVKALGGIFVADAAKDGSVRRLTPEGWKYSFGPVIKAEESESGAKLLCTYQSMYAPTEVCVVETGGEQARVDCISHENDHILNQLAEVGEEEAWLPCENGDSLHCWILYPPHFDAQKKYPALEMLNGGPQTSLDQSWSYRWNFMLMAHKGYVVILPNRHGDSGFGQAWKEEISGDYCGLNMKDYLIAGEYIKSKDFTGKLAAAGASYGGYSAYMLEGLQDGLFDCIISHAGIFDEKAQWFTTEEMWFPNWDNGGLTEYACAGEKTGPEGDGVTFGGLQQAGAPYSKIQKVQNFYANSPDSMVGKWKTPILCMHGMKDFRIPYTQGMAAFNAARMMGVPARLVLFPEACHWVLKPQDALLWHHEFFAWADKWTKEQ